MPGAIIGIDNENRLLELRIRRLTIFIYSILSDCRIFPLDPSPLVRSGLQQVQPKRRERLWEDKFRGSAENQNQRNLREAIRNKTVNNEILADIVMVGSDVRRMKRW